MQDEIKELLKASLPWVSAHREAECYLDNDAPGRKTLTVSQTDVQEWKSATTP